MTSIVIHHFKSRRERHSHSHSSKQHAKKKSLGSRVVNRLSIGFSLLTPGRAKRDLFTAVFRWISSDNDDNYNCNKCGCGKRHWLCGLTGFVRCEISGTSSKE